MFDSFVEHHDFNFTCPFPAQKFKLFNFVPQDKFLPPILLLKSVNFELIINFDGQLINSKKTTFLFSIKVYGEINNNKRFLREISGST